MVQEHSGSVEQREYPWIHYLSDSDIVFMNTGAHHVGDQEFLGFVKGAINHINSNFPNILVIFRNTPPGHSNCQLDSVPRKNPEEEAKMWYQWSYYRYQNMMAYDLLKEESLSFYYLDVTSATKLRCK